MTDVPPTMTVLEYLRTLEKRTGTKEGCGEGDCGACTISLGELNGNELQYRSVNACIQFLPMLDGKQILTIEELAAPSLLPDRAIPMHTVQQAIVDSHGTQCGFCTPGFAMSLFTLNRTNKDPSRKEIDNALAGNLCRCTGYNTIVEAAQNIAEDNSIDHLSKQEPKTIKMLAAINDGTSLHYNFDDQKFFAPTSIDELAVLYEQYPDSTLVSGGTDVGLWVTKLGKKLDTVIYMGRVEALNKIDVSDAEISVWAGCRQSDVLPVLSNHYTDFAELLRRFGSTQIRNAGTMCGNIANGSPIGDSAPALLALDAKITLRLGTRNRDIKLKDFFIDYGVHDRKPGEFVEKITFPVANSESQFRVYKISKRFDQDISAVCCALNLTMKDDKVFDIKIAFGGMAATPKRARAVEAAVIGKQWCEETIDEAIEAIDLDFEPLTDVRASSSYRMLVSKNLLRKFYLETSGALYPLRVVDGEDLLHA